jgi:hypothetical protein
MSDENLKAAKSFFPAPWDLAEIFSSPEAIAALRAQFEPVVEPDFETIHDPSAMPLGIGTPKSGGVARGMEGFIALWRDFLSAWESWLVTATDFVDLDDERVLVLMTFIGRSKTHGAELSLDGGNILCFREGKLARLEMFLRRDSALAAAGVPE